VVRLIVLIPNAALVGCWTSQRNKIHFEP
jgi:hypothetical protein